jgi:hypothetical protein
MDFIFHLTYDLISHGNRPTHPKVVKNEQTWSREINKKEGIIVNPKSLF